MPALVYNEHKTIINGSRGRMKERISIIIAILIGIGAGLFAVLFRYLVMWAETAYHQITKSILATFIGDGWIIFVPALAGLVVGPFIYLTAKEAKGTGIPDVMEAIALHGGKIRKRTIFTKAIASSTSIGGGGSVGGEGPIIQIGASIGSIVGQLFRLNQKMMKTYVACGAAAGIAATFNTPITGVIFAQEIILGEFVSGAFVLIVISAVTAAAIAGLFLGSSPAFLVDTYVLNSPIELTFYALLGVITALVAIVFIKVLYKTEDLFNLVKTPEWFKPAIGGLLVGIIGLGFPQILGIGYTTIERIFLDDFLLPTLMMLVLFKILATSITLGSGHSGGIFAPSLFIGASLGGGVGMLLQFLFPNLVLHSNAYAIVGMGAMVAGVTQAPITAVMMIFEMTQDFTIILPLMIAVVFSTWISSYLSKDNIFTLKLARKGIKIRAGHDVNVLKNIIVDQVMTTPVEVVQENDRVGNVIKMMHDSKHNGFPVVNYSGQLCGIITLQDIREAPVKGIMDKYVRMLMSKKLIVTFPEESLEDVFHKLSDYDLGHLPVVKHEDEKVLLGIVTRSDVIKAYSRQKINDSQATSAINT